MKHPDPEANLAGAVALGIATSLVVVIAQGSLLANDVIFAADFGGRTPVLTIEATWTITAIATVLLVVAIRSAVMHRFARVAIMSAAIAIVVPEAPCAIAMSVAAHHP
jgi:hypothetical protein